MILAIHSMKKLIWLQLSRNKRICKMKFQKLNQTKDLRLQKMMKMIVKRMIKKKHQNLRRLNTLKTPTRQWTALVRDLLSIN
jgi:hypothetical protein